MEQTSPCQEHSKVTPNILRPEQNGCQFADNIFKCIFLDENHYMLIQNPLKFVRWGSIDKKSALVQMMTLYQTGTKSLPSGANGDPVHWHFSLCHWANFLSQIGLPLLWWNKDVMNSIVNSSPLDKMAPISQTIFSDAYLWMKSSVFWLKFHWSLFLRVELTIAQHWLRQWLGTE